MSKQSDWTSCRILNAVLLLVLVVAGSTASAQETPVELSIVYQFVTGTLDEIAVDIFVDDATGVAGIDFQLDYPAGAFDGTPSWELVDMSGLFEVNALTPGVLICTFANSSGHGETNATLARFTFPVDCVGAPPSGISAALSLSDLAVYVIEGEDVVLKPSVAVDETIQFCVTTPADTPSFGMLKASYSPRP